MRIWFINRFFYPDLPATAQILTELAEDLVAQGAHVTVVTGRVVYLGGEASLPGKDFYKGIEIRRVWSTSFGRRSALGRLVDYVSFNLSALVVSPCAKREDCLVVLTSQRSPIRAGCQCAILASPWPGWRRIPLVP